MSRTNLYLSPYGRAGAGRDFLVFGSFSALKPPLSHPIPRALDSGISGGSGHLFAFGGVFRKLLSRIDRCHRRSLLGFPVPTGHHRGPNKIGNRHLIPFGAPRLCVQVNRLHPRPQLPARLDLGLGDLGRCPDMMCSGFLVLLVRSA